MDFSLLAPLAPTLLWLLPLALVIGLLKLPWMKGYLGELLVRLFATGNSTDRYTAVCKI